MPYKIVHLLKEHKCETILVSAVQNHSLGFRSHLLDLSRDPAPMCRYSTKPTMWIVLTLDRYPVQPQSINCHVNHMPFHCWLGLEYSLIHAFCINGISPFSFRYWIVNNIIILIFPTKWNMRNLTIEIIVFCSWRSNKVVFYCNNVGKCFLYYQHYL